MAMAQSAVDAIHCVQTDTQYCTQKDRQRILLMMYSTFGIRASASGFTLSKNNQANDAGVDFIRGRRSDFTQHRSRYPIY